MYAGRPIIGIVGGIGAGKSFVASIFGEMGCVVIDSDELVRRAYEREDVKVALRQWWGEGVFKADGAVDRAAVGRRVFADEGERRRLEGLIHPLVGRMRDEVMAAAANDRGVVGYVWDAPLLIEAGLAGECDAVVFVEAPMEVRAERVAGRGWEVEELIRREKSQLPLDNKRKVAKYIVRNTAGAGEIRNQVRKVLSRILAGMSDGETLEHRP